MSEDRCFSHEDARKDFGYSPEPFETENTRDLINKVEKFLGLDYETKKQMGLAGRKKVEKEFDRKIVVDAYLKEVEII